jgi:ribosomal-protein-alanine N-acetyltransferase
MIKLRKFELSDSPSVIKIAKISFPKERILAKSFEKHYHAFPDGFIVSEELGEIIGYVVGQLKNQMGEIISLAVKPNFRQKGVGTELVNLLSNHFKIIGLREFFLHVKTDNVQAVLFFQNLDLRIIKTIKKYYKKRDDAFLMGKAI